MRRLALTAAAAFLVLLVLPAPALAAWSWPVSGAVVTEYRNGDDPYAAGQHRGIDIAAEIGAQVVAASAGEVLFAGTAGSSGLTVSVRTDDGFDTSYLHLSAASVRRGERIAAGERLGAVGMSGSRSLERPHLHFGVREAGSRHAYRDPLSLLPARPGAAPEEPRPVPAPAPAPLPVAPAPAPAPAPRAIPRTPRAPAQRRFPDVRRAPSGRRVQAPLPVRAPAPRQLRRPAPARARIPHARRPEHSPARARPGSPPARAAAPHDGAGSVPRRRELPAAGQAPDGGPDLGWALACAGLLLAAGLLGLTDDGRRASARGRARLVGALRPLLGRRT